MERRLSAILAADVVGFSRLVEADEAAAFERLRAHRKELFEPEIARHRGRIFKLMGDGLLAEFDSVVDAVECAVSLQRGMAERNGEAAGAQRIDMRVGINLGDVIVEADDRHGEGVVIAARLQQLADPGGIAVSRTVANHVKHKLALRFEPLGAHRVKNIAEPVEVYRIALGAVPQMRPRRQYPPRAWHVAAAAAVLVAGAGMAWHLSRPIEETSGAAAPAPLAYGGDVQAVGPAPAAQVAVTPPPAPGSAAVQPVARADQGIPVIVVLPFQDLTGDQVRSDLGMGIAEALITDLSTFPDFEVLSSTSSFAYAGRPIPEVVAATGAMFVIEGSIRRSGERAMVTVQLIRGSTDRHLKIAQLEEKMTDPVTLQGAVATRIRDELGGMTGFLRQEYNRIALAKDDGELTEYDYYVLGHIPSLKSDMRSAGEIWKKGLERFPGSIVLRCKVAMAALYADDDVDQAATLMSEAGKLPKRSRLDDWYYHWMEAQLYRFQGENEAAVAEARRTIAMAPYDTVSRANLVWVLIDARHNDEAIEWAKFAVTNDPEPMDWYFEGLLTAYRRAGKMGEGLKLAEAEIRADPSPSPWWYHFLGMAYSATGQSEKATAAFKVFYSQPAPQP